MTQTAQLTQPVYFQQFDPGVHVFDTITQEEAEAIASWLLKRGIDTHTEDRNAPKVHRLDYKGNSVYYDEISTPS